MTVGELIHKLQQYPSDRPIFVCGDDASMYWRGGPDVMFEEHQDDPYLYVIGCDRYTAANNYPEECESDSDSQNSERKSP